MLAVLSSECSHAPPPNNSTQVPQVSVVTVHRGTVPVTTELPGRTSPYLVAQVRARVDGIVQRRDFTEGSVVTAAQRLYQIDRAPYQASLDSATASLEKANANLASTTATGRALQGAGRRERSEPAGLRQCRRREGQAAADVATGKAAVATAQINLGYTSVHRRSRAASVRPLVTQGAYVQASAATLMATVQQTDPIYVDLSQASVRVCDCAATSPTVA